MFYVNKFSVKQEKRKPPLRKVKISGRERGREGRRNGGRKAKESW